jgi:hypothetical protein
VCLFSSIQDVPGGKFTILGDHSIGHSKNKVYMNMCPIPNGFRDRAILMYSCKIIDTNEILRTVSNIYCSSEKIVSL